MQYSSSCRPAAAATILILLSSCVVYSVQQNSTTITTTSSSALETPQLTNLTISPKECNSTEFSCPQVLSSRPGVQNNVFCIPSTWVCDGEEDCPSGSDETRELCGGSSSSQSGSELRIPTSSITGQCQSDSYYCRPLTSSSSWSKCIPNTWLCDGNRDCPHGDDEITSSANNCTASAFTSSEEQQQQALCHAVEEFQCVGDGMCIEKRQMCDYTPDCADESDEAECFLVAVEVVETPDNTNAPEAGAINDTESAAQPGNRTLSLAL